MMLLLAALVTVTGMVVGPDDVPLPGVMVTLTNRSASLTAVTDERGAYSFRRVPEDSYDLRYEMAGFVAVEQRFTAEEGRSDVPAQRMELDSLSEPIVIACGRPCSKERPATPYDPPLCSDVDLHTTWIEAADQGDPSAVALLRTRYAETLSLTERHRLGAALMRDDSHVWTELLAEAETSVRFTRENEELLAQAQWWASFDALTVIATDPRSRALLLQALALDDRDLVFVAIGGLAAHRDVASLPAIERAIRRFPDEASLMAFALSLMASPAADEVAMKYLDEPMREDYARERAVKAATLTQ